MTNIVTMSLPWRLKGKEWFRVDVQAPHWSLFAHPRMVDIREATLELRDSFEKRVTRHTITFVLFGKIETPPESGPLIGFVQIAKHSYAVYHKRR